MYLKFENKSHHEWERNGDTINVKMWKEKGISKTDLLRLLVGSGAAVDLNWFEGFANRGLHHPELFLPSLRILHCPRPCTVLCCTLSLTLAFYELLLTPTQSLQFCAFPFPCRSKLWRRGEERYEQETHPKSCAIETLCMMRMRLVFRHTYM